VFEDANDFVARQTIIVDATTVEASNGSKAKRIEAKAETEADIDAAAEIGETKARCKDGVRR
jgi:hypothetical protein